MKRIAIPKNKEEMRLTDYCGVTVFLQLDTNQKWTMTNTSSGYITLAKKGQKLRLTYAAFNKLFEEVRSDTND